MDYNSNNNNRVPNQQMGMNRMPNGPMQGQMNGMQGMPNQQMPNQQMGMGRMPNGPMQGQMNGMQGMPNQGIPNQQMPNQQMGMGRMPNGPMQGQMNRMQGMPNQGMPNQQMPNQQMGMGRMPNGPMQGQMNGMQGMPNQGIPNQQMPNQQMGMGRMPNGPMQGQMNGMQGMPNQGIPNQQMPNQQMGMGRMPNGPMQGQMNRMQGMPNQQIAGRQPGMNRPGIQPSVNGAQGGLGGDASERLARELEKSMSKPKVKSKHNLPPEDYDEFDDYEDSKPLKRFGEGFNFKFGLKLPDNVSAGVMKYAAFIFAGILLVCLVITLLCSGFSSKGGSSKKGKVYNFPTDMVTFTGIIPEIYENMLAKTGQGTSNATYNSDGSELPAAPMAEGEGTSADGMTVSNTADTAGTSGASMVVDSGAGTDGYQQAGSYEELLSQLESAIAAGDSSFVGSKLAYEDENGNISGYPQSVVDYFTSYMSTNSDKRSAFMAEIKSDSYATQNGDAYIVKFPLIKFVVNMGYDNTTVSLSGFSEQLVNSGQSAEIKPLLPGCMYTLVISNPDWNEPVSKDIEANVNELTLSINVKP